MGKTLSRLRASKQLTSQSSSEPIRFYMWRGSMSLVKSVSREELDGPIISWISGGVYVDGEGLLVTYYNSKKLLLFDDEYNYVRHYDVYCEPSDVTHGFTANEVLVAFQQDSLIMRYILQGGILTEVCRISAPDCTWGVAVFGENILVGTPQDVQVIKTDGTAIKSFSICGQYTHEGKIYHKDDDVIVCRSRDGEELFRHTFRGLRAARGISVDHKGNVYVCGMNSGNVHVMSADGSKERLILPTTSDITVPWAVIVHPTRRDILVTSFRQNVAFEVYRLRT